MPEGTYSGNSESKISETNFSGTIWGNGFRVFFLVDNFNQLGGNVSWRVVKNINMIFQFKVETLSQERDK